MSQTTASFGFRDVDASQKAGLVRGVFDRVASRYDVMNDVMSAGVHRIWKDMAVARMNPQPGETIIDMAGGTGDLARRMAKLARGAQARRGGADARIMVMDINGEMIAAGLSKGGAPEITWTVADAEKLPLPAACADGYVISFGLRNVTNILAALIEARRVLKPGGRFLCLEFSKPATELLRSAYDAYSFNVIPALGGLIAGDKDSYRYLVESIRRFPDQEVLADLMRQAGFGRVGYTNYTAGVCALHHGWAV